MKLTIIQTKVVALFILSLVLCGVISSRSTINEMRPHKDENNKLTPTKAEPEKQSFYKKFTGMANSLIKMVFDPEYTKKYKEAIEINTTLAIKIKKALFKSTILF